jgi:hypothetical protein
MKLLRSMALLSALVVIAGYATTEAARPETGNPVVRLEITALHQSSNRQVSSYGSGFFVTFDGYIVTNEHVVRPIVEKERCKTQVVKVRINQGQRDEQVVTGTIFASDRVADLAVVKIPGSQNRPVLTLAVPHTLQPGTPVRAQGYPLGGPYKETQGIVIADLPANTVRPTSLILCSAPVQPGNSGGPVLDGQGNVIGVAVAVSHIKLLQDVKPMQEAARDTLTKMRSALAEAGKEMQAQGDKEGYVARMEALAKQGMAALDKYAKQSWVLAEAVLHPDKTHVIAVADVIRLLDQWRVKRQPFIGSGQT